MNGRAATIARVAGLGAVVLLAAILGLVAGNAVKSLSSDENVVRLEPQTNVWGNTGPGNIPNLGGLVPENPGGTVVDRGTDHPRGGQRKADDGAPDYADPYRQYVEAQGAQSSSATAPSLR